MTYVLGNGSNQELIGVHPDLVGMAQRAILITLQDFSVHDGLRTIEEQREYVRTKVSRTLKSMHLPQRDGLGHALDLVPYINGKLRWELDACIVIAKAVRQAANELKVPIVWGGCWRRIDNNTEDLRRMVDGYIALRQSQGRPFFVDAAHFQMPN